MLDNISDNYLESLLELARFDDVIEDLLIEEIVYENCSTFQPIINEKGICS